MMTVNDKVLAGLAVALLLIGVAYLSVPALVQHGLNSLQSAPHELPPVAAGDRAAAFSLKDLDGNTVSLSALKGKVIFLNVWATWCGPCRDEMPSMETLYNEFKSNKDFVMLAVSQDRESQQAVRSYVDRMAITSGCCWTRTTRSARPTT